MKDYLVKTNPHLDQMIARYKEPEPMPEPTPEPMPEPMPERGEDLPRPLKKAETMSPEEYGARFSDLYWRADDWREDSINPNDKDFLFWFIGAIILISLSGYGG